jgi:hypothetical protein
LVGCWGSAYEICRQAFGEGELADFLRLRVKLIVIGRSIDDTTSMATSIFTCPFISFLSFYKNIHIAFDK